MIKEPENRQIPQGGCLRGESDPGTIQRFSHYSIHMQRKMVLITKNHSDLLFKITQFILPSIRFYNKIWCDLCPMAINLDYQGLASWHDCWANTMALVLAAAAAAAAKSLQLCPTLCDPIDSRAPGPAVPGILQARTLQWVAISSSNALKWKMKVKALSRVRLPETPWTAAYHAPPCMGFFRKEYWSGVPLPSI